MDSVHSCFAAALISLTCACSGAGTSGTNTAAATLPLNTSSQDLYTAVFSSFQALSSADRAAVRTEAGSIGISSYYESLLNAASTSLVIDGENLPSSPAALQSLAATYTSLNSQYGTLAAYWQALHVDPAALSLNDFRLALNAANPNKDKGKNKGLALDLDDPVQMVNGIVAGAQNVLNLCAAAAGTMVFGEKALAKLRGDDMAAAQAQQDSRKVAELQARVEAQEAEIRGLQERMAACEVMQGRNPSYRWGNQVSDADADQ